MARRKQTVIQRDMSLGEIRPDFLERSDTDLKAASVKKAENMRLLTSGAAQARPGLKFLYEVADDEVLLCEWEVERDQTWGVLAKSGSIILRNSFGGDTFTFSTTGIFDTASAVVTCWAVPIGETVYIGNFEGIAVLTADVEIGASISIFYDLNELEFDASSNGNSLRPFWKFETSGVTLQPSARTGNITITSSTAFFTDAYVEDNVSIIRYGEVQILLTGRNSDTEATGTVQGTLPPTFRLSIGSSAVAELSVGDVVIGQDTNYQGQIVAKGTTTIDVFTINGFDGPDNGEKISGPSSTATSSSKSTQSPAATTIWDEPMLSKFRGFPKSASFAAGRLVLTNFPNIPSGIAISSGRTPTDFETGVRDDDAIIREIGDDRPVILHVRSVGDLVFLTDRGCYRHELRDGSILTPLNFNPLLFDRRGANEVLPVQVSDGLVFVDRSGTTIAAALLDGDVNLKWRVRTLTDNHSHLIKNPVSLSAPSLTTQTQENYLFVINDDGTLAAISYSQSLSEPSIGIVPWSTDGEFKGVQSTFSTYWALVDRVADGVTKRFLEEFDEDIYLDCAVTTSSGPGDSPLVGRTVKIIDGIADLGDFVVASDGSITDEPGSPSDRQAGLDFSASIEPWAVQIIESVRHGVFDARCIRFLISVQDTVAIDVKCNKHTRTLGGYAFGETLDQQPPLRTERYAVPVFGVRQNAELAVSKAQPGPFRILYLGQEVQS